MYQNFLWVILHGFPHYFISYGSLVSIVLDMLLFSALEICIIICTYLWISYMSIINYYYNHTHSPTQLFHILFNMNTAQLLFSSCFFSSCSFSTSPLSPIYSILMEWLWNHPLGHVKPIGVKPIPPKKHDFLAPSIYSLVIASPKVWRLHCVVCNLQNSFWLDTLLVLWFYL